MWGWTRGFLVVAALLYVVVADVNTHRYKTDESVVLWTNKVGPFPNPQETYPYYSLPFCRPDKMEHFHSEGFGETILGYDLIASAIPLSFGKDASPTVICSKSFTDKEVEQLRYAVKHEFWYQLFLDDLPIWGMVGEGEDSIFTHSRLEIGFNKDRILEVNLTSENPKSLSKTSGSLKFSYEVKWVEKEGEFSRRFERYLKDDFLEGHIHWFSLVNSVMMVLFLSGMVLLILVRTLRKDLQFYRDVESAGLEDDDSGWKQVHADVFRPPPHLPLLSALVGSGCQLTLLAGSVVTLAFFGELHEERGVLLTFATGLYALSSALGGMVSGSFYQQNGGKQWIRTALLTATFFPGIVAVIGLALDGVATAYKSQSSIPIGTLLLLFLLWGAVAFPLFLLGSILGRHLGPFKGGAPTKVSAVPRRIPQSRWYMDSSLHMVLAGALPFGSMFIEMYYLFSSFWHYQYYYVFGFLGAIFFNVLLVCICMTILLVYLCLNREDHRWWWMAFLCPASTGLYVFLYSVYYFQNITLMHGFLQTCFFFGYMAIASISVALIAGAVGFIAAYYFVRLIFRNVKID